MADREKVIKGLECCTNSDMSMCLDECPYPLDGEARRRTEKEGEVE